MQEKSFDIIAAGHICLDMFPKFNLKKNTTIQDLFRPGMLIDMGNISFSTGGAVSNTGIALKIFGNKVGFIAKVGDDYIGQIITKIISEKGDASGIKISKGESSSYTVVLSPPGIDRIFLHCSGTNHTFTAKDINFNIVKQARHFHFGYPSLMRSTFINNGAELLTIFKKATACNITTSLDISFPDPESPAGKADWKSIYKKVLPFVDIFVPSVEEAYFTLHPREYLALRSKNKGKELLDLLNADDFSRLAGEFIGMGCRMIALKAGHNGWYFKTAPASTLKGKIIEKQIDVSNWAGREVWCPAFQVKRIASATGSGDTSIAAFLTSVIKKFSIEESLKFANCAGAMNLSEMDAVSGLKSWNEMRAFIEKSNIRKPTQMPPKNWKWDQDGKIWEKNKN